MGFFDNLANASFDKDILDRWIFYPWGPLGKGYVLTGDEQQDRIRNGLKNMYLWLFPVGMLSSAINIAVGAVLGGIFILGYVIIIKRLTKKLETTPKQLTMTESFEKTFASYNLISLIFLEFLCLLFAAFGIWAVVSGGNIFAGLAFIIGGALAAIPAGYVIKRRYM